LCYWQGKPETDVKFMVGVLKEALAKKLVARGGK